MLDTVPDQRYKFTGKERDTESGLDFFIARYYSSGYGRFLSPDEFTGGAVDAFSSSDPIPAGPLPYALITNPQSLNKYTYIFNNPLSYIDPDGHGALDFAWGAIESLSSNFAGGDRRTPTSNPDQKAGQVVGDVLSVVVGVAGAVVAGTASVSADVSSGGAALVLAPAQVAAVAIPAIGAMRGAASLVNSFSSDRPGTHGNPDHWQTGAEEAAKMGPKGQQEVRVQTPGGEKGHRGSQRSGSSIAGQDSGFSQHLLCVNNFPVTKYSH